MRRRTFLFSPFAFIPTTPLLRARPNRLVTAQWKQSSPSPTFSTGVKVVNVFANVRDKDGHIVTHLAKEDFTLLEDDRPYIIRYFSQQSDLPPTLGLLLDTSMSERRSLATERDTTHAFLEQVLRPEKDRAFLIHFDRAWSCFRI